MLATESDSTVPQVDFEDYPVKIIQHQIKGRCFMAKRDIRAGEVVLVSKPYVVIPDSGNVDKICFKCARPDSKSKVKCGKCRIVGYCDDGCLQQDSIIHAKECSFFSDVLPNTDFDDYTRDYTILILRVLLRKLMGLDEALSDGLSFKHVWNLCSNMNGFTEAKLKEFNQVALKLHDYLKAKFTNIPTQQDIVELICKEECNSFGLYSYHKPRQPRQAYGLALFPTAVYFNHSCYPNIVHTTHGTNQMFFAARDIAKDDELCITYISIRQRTEDRQKELRSVFLFQCDCPRCVAADQEHVFQDLLKKQICTRDSCFGVYLPYVSGNELATGKCKTIQWKCEACNFEK